MRREPLPRKLNVCMVARHFPIVGRTTDHSFLRLIARGLTQRGHRVTVLASENPLGEEFLEQDRVRIHFLNERRNTRRDLFDDRIKEKFADLHRSEPFHLVHSVDPAAYRIGKFKRAYRIAMAYDVDATQMAQIYSILGMGQETLGSLLSTSLAVAYKFLTTYLGRDRALLSTADGVFVASPQQRIMLERYYLFPDSRIYHVPYGIEVGDLSPREKSDELRRLLGIPESAKVVATLTDMTEVRETAHLLDAFQAVAIKKPNVRLLILGNGPRFKEIEHHMLNLALGSKVIFTGAVKNTEIPDHIALADVFVNLSARSTGFEPSLLEAMAQKKVIIGSEVSPISTVVQHSHDGFLIRPADTAELARLIFDIFAGQLSTANIGEHARAKVLNLFDTEKMVVETINAYYTILRSTGMYSRMTA